MAPPISTFAATAADPAVSQKALAQAVAVAYEALRHQAQVLQHVASRTHIPGFAAVLQALWGCRGQVVLTGVGKSGHVARKAAATFASIGARATFMHATEAVHGDLGQLGAQDVVLALSFSGASAEVLALVAPLRHLRVPLLALTGNPGAPLAQSAQAACILGPIAEACPLNLVPTASTTAMMAVTDAWAMGLFALLGQSAAAYGARHPAGALGLGAKRVASVMRTGSNNPVAPSDASIAQVLRIMTATPGRPGAAAIVAEDGTLAGMFTDGDVRRLLLAGPLDVQAPIASVMQASPKTVGQTDLVAHAMAVLQRHAIDQVLVVDGAHRPVGLVDIHDVLPGGGA